MPLERELYDTIVDACDAAVESGDAGVMGLEAVLSRLPCAASSWTECGEGEEQAPAPTSAHWRGVPHALIMAVLRQRYTHHIKRTTGRHRRAAMGYWHRWREGRGSLVDIARSVNYSPYMLARLVLEVVLGVEKGDVGGYVRSPHTIPDPALRADVLEATAADMFCSPGVDAARAAAGVSGERGLEAALTAAGVPFMTEADLRGAGFSKTPDVKLEVPIAIPVARVGSATAWRIIHWIDSKAVFGDPGTHAEYEEQFAGYVHRFGPGLVIYWNDYVAGIGGDMHAAGTGGMGSGGVGDVMVTHTLPPVTMLPGGRTVQLATASAPALASDEAVASDVAWATSLPGAGAGAAPV